MIREAGLYPVNWSVIHEDEKYLHLIDRPERREVRIIDKATYEVMAEKPRAEPGSSGT